MRAVVTPGSGSRLDIGIRQHVLGVDQPVDAGGEDSAPTPVELLLASLASCVAHYARGYLQRHDLPLDGLRVEATAELAQRPARVDAFAITVHLPDGVPDDRRVSLLAVASHCTVHNTLSDGPSVSIRLEPTATPPPSVQL